MSERNDILFNENETKEELKEEVRETSPKSDNPTRRVVVKRKRFKKSDLLVFAVCFVVSVAIWLYATNLQKAAEDKEIADIKGAVQSGVQSGINKNTDSAGNTEDACDDSSDAQQNGDKFPVDDKNSGESNSSENDSEQKDDSSLKLS